LIDKIPAWMKLPFALGMRDAFKMLIKQNLAMDMFIRTVEE